MKTRLFVSYPWKKTAYGYVKRQYWVCERCGKSHRTKYIKVCTCGAEIDGYDNCDKCKHYVADSCEMFECKFEGNNDEERM